MRPPWLPGIGLGIAALFLQFPRPQQANADQLPLTPVTFDHEIVTLLKNHCIMCHGSGGSSFPIGTYEQTYFARLAISKSLLSRQMPPWSVVPGYDDFANSNALNFREVQFMWSWTYGTAPRSDQPVFLNVVDPNAKPAQVIQAHFDPNFRALGAPDLVLSVPENAGVRGQQEDSVERVVVDSALSRDRWLSGIEYSPANRDAIHAVFFKIEESNQWIGSWTPWYGFFKLPVGLSYRLPARAHIIAEIHYSGGKALSAGHGSLDLYFAHQPSSRAVASEVLSARCGRLDGAGSQQRCAATSMLATDANILSLWPTISSDEEAVEVSTAAPDGAVRVLLYARNPAASWPTPYVLKTPVPLVKGTRLSIVSYYEANARLPRQSDLTVCAYEGEPIPVASPATAVSAGPTQPVRRFKLVGIIQSVDREDHSLVVRHGDIPGLMAAMTMTYAIATKEDLTRIAAGDRIEADLVVIGESDMHLENIKVIGHSK